MNFLLTVGLLLLIGFIAGWLFDQIGIPRIIGYVATGIIFSPKTSDFIQVDFTDSTDPVLEICLAFIAFEVGGALKWSRIKSHEKEIISITLLASFLPFVFIAGGIYTFGKLFPDLLPYDSFTLLTLSLLLGALASPTAPAATLAVIHQYKARGKVTDTILGVSALDDVLGIFLFSVILAAIFLFNGMQPGMFGNPVVNSLYQILGAMLMGVILAKTIDPVARLLGIHGEGQWVVIIFSIITFGAGVAEALSLDMLLAEMTMGMVVVNHSKHQKIIFRILERYTEDLIFLFFFVLSGLHLDLSTIPQATILILLFVVLRTAGKYAGASSGAALVKADRAIRRYTAGGLLPQAGIVIGLVLSIYQETEFARISELLLTTIMGATLIHELIGPVAAKHSLTKAGEIKQKKRLRLFERFFRKPSQPK